MVVCIIVISAASVGIFAYLTLTGSAPIKPAAFAVSLAGMTVAIILAIIWIPLFFTKHIIDKPMSELSAATNAVINNDLSGALHINSNDEFRVYSENFTTMLGIVQKKIDDAKEANRLNQITISTLENIMNSINTSVYVIDAATYKLLFVNKWLKAYYGRENDDVTGEYCYKMFRNFDEKCDFCPCGKLEENPDQTVVWEEFLEPFRVYVRHTFCYIDWPTGEKVILQYGIDITDIREKQAK